MNAARFSIADDSCYPVLLKKPSRHDQEKGSSSAREEESSFCGKPLSQADAVFQPGPYDVLCDRHLVAFHHVGNKRFRVICEIYTPKYGRAKTRQERSHIFNAIIATVRGGGGTFLTKSGTTEDYDWNVVGDLQVKDKIRHTLRAAVIAFEAASDAGETRSILDVINGQYDAHIKKQRRASHLKKLPSFPDMSGSFTSTRPIALPRKGNGGVLLGHRSSIEGGGLMVKELDNKTELHEFDIVVSFSPEKKSIPTSNKTVSSSYQPSPSSSKSTEPQDCDFVRPWSAASTKKTPIRESTTTCKQKHDTKEKAKLINRRLSIVAIAAAQNSETENVFQLPAVVTKTTIATPKTVCRPTATATSNLLAAKTVAPQTASTPTHVGCLDCEKKKILHHQRRDSKKKSVSSTPISVASTSSKHLPVAESDATSSHHDDAAETQQQSEDQQDKADAHPLLVLRYDIFQEPGHYDVLCDRSTAAFNHIGNTRFRSICTNFVPQYKKAQTKGQKGKIFKAVFSLVSKSGGKFLARDSNSGKWEELSSSRRTIGKVGHALRAAVQQQSEKDAAEQQSSSIKNDTVANHNAIEDGAQDQQQAASPISISALSNMMDGLDQRFMRDVLWPIHEVAETEADGRPLSPFPLASFHF